MASATERTKVMILGVYHFNNPGLDVAKATSFDHLSVQAQKEIAEVNRQLVRFNANKVFIEAPVTNQTLYSKRYQKYLSGEFNVSNKANEIYQLGFRVAAQLKHNDIYTMDAPGIFPWQQMQKGLTEFKLNDVKTALEKNFSRYKQHDKENANRTVLQRLVNLNHPAMIAKDHLFYNDISPRVIAEKPSHKLAVKTETTDHIEHLVVPLDPDYIGAELTAEWYKRNIKIFANIYRKVELAEDNRVLLIIGAGHLRILRHLFDDNPNFELIDTNQILTSVH